MVRLAAAFALVALTLGTNRALAITFADGQVHVIDAANSFPFEEVFVRDGPADTSTSVNLVPGGKVGTGLDLGLHVGHGSVICARL